MTWEPKNKLDDEDVEVSDDDEKDKDDDRHGKQNEILYIQKQTKCKVCQTRFKVVFIKCAVEICEHLVCYKTLVKRRKIAISQMLYNYFFKKLLMPKLPYFNGFYAIILYVNHKEKTTLNIFNSLVGHIDRKFYVKKIPQQHLNNANYLER